MLRQYSQGWFQILPLLMALVLSTLCMRALAGGENVNLPASHGLFIQAVPITSITLRRELNNSYIKKLDVAYLWYRRNDGGFDQTNDLYLSGYFDNGQPIILARFPNAIQPKLQVLDLNNDGIRQVLVEFTQGAAGKICEVFNIQRIKYKLHVDRVDNGLIYSNLSKIDVTLNKKLGKYVFKTVNDIPDLLPSTKHKVITATLVLQDNHVKVIRTVSAE